MRVVHTSTSRAMRRRVLTFGLLTALMASGYGVMFTVLDDFRDEYGISGSWLGLIVATGFFASFLTQTLVAPFADRGYARRLVYAGLLFNVVGLIGMATSQTTAPLLASRFIMGLGVGMAYPAIRRIVILSDPTNLGGNLGMMLSADVAGFAAGPALSALLVGTFGLAAPFLVIAVLIVCCLPVVARVKVVESETAPASRFAFDLLRHRPFAAALLMGSAVFMMIGTFDALWSVVLDDLEAADWMANIGITLFALPLVVLGSTGGRLAQRVGPFVLGAIGLLLGAVYVFCYGLMPTGLAMLGIGLLHAITDGFTVSSTGVAVGMVTPAHRQASGQGLLGAAETLTAGTTAAVAGFLYEEFGRFTAYTACAVCMVAMVLASHALVGSSWRMRGEPVPMGGAQPSAATSTSVSL